MLKIKELLSRTTYASVGHLIEVFDIFSIRVFHEGGLEAHLRTEFVLNDAYFSREFRGFYDPFN
jgi:hypothetical protein